MARARTARRTLAAALALVVAAVVVLGLMPATGWAHGALRRSTPADSARLTTAPRELRLEFTERPEMAVTTVTLLGARGDTVALASLAAVPDSNRVVVAPIRGGLAAGRYTVEWQTAGADGHPVRGRFTFTILDGAAGLEPAGPDPSVAAHGAHQAGTHQGGEPGASVVAPGQDVPPAEHHLTGVGGTLDAESPLYVGVRWLLFTALIAVLGAATFPLAVVGRTGAALGREMRSEIRRRAARVGVAAGVVLLAGVLLRLVLQSSAMHGTGRAFDGALVGTMLGQTVWGWAWLLQAAAAVVVVGGFSLAVRGRTGGWAGAGLAALALVVTPALSGHAAAVPRLVPLAIGADALHVLGAGGWLGGLLLLVIVGVPLALRSGTTDQHQALASLVRGFSPVALTCAALTAATGVLSAWLHLPAVEALWTTRYGWLLLGKLALLVIVAGLGAYNWRRVAPTLGDAAGSVRLARSARAELVVGAAVLLVTAILVATPPPIDGAP